MSIFIFDGDGAPDFDNVPDLGPFKYSKNFDERWRQKGGRKPMTREEIKEYLEDRLQISVTCDLDKMDNERLRVFESAINSIKSMKNAYQDYRKRLNNCDPGLVNYHETHADHCLEGVKSRTERFKELIRQETNRQNIEREADLDALDKLAKKQGIFYKLLKRKGDDK